MTRFGWSWVVVLGIAFAAANQRAQGEECSRSCAADQRDERGCCPAPTPAPKPASKPTAKPASATGSTAASMATIPAGTFLMGSPGSEPGRKGDEVQHPVTVSSFRLMKTEVTQAMFESVMGFNPAAVGSQFWYGGEQGACREFDGVPLVDPSFPVMCVTWMDGVEFANALSRKEGLPPAYVINNGVVARVAGSTGYRFPTEAEWEYAARAGTTTPYATVSSSEHAVCGAANVGDATVKAKWARWTTFGCSDGVLGLARVGSFAANAWGLHDMIGNVWEWVEDGYGVYPPGSVTDPAGPSAGSSRVDRGGGWDSGPAGARVAGRDGLAPGSRNSNLGFRLARSGP